TQVEHPQDHVEIQVEHDQTQGPTLEPQPHEHHQLEPPCTQEDAHTHEHIQGHEPHTEHASVPRPLYSSVSGCEVQVKGSPIVDESRLPDNADVGSKIKLRLYLGRGKGSNRRSSRTPATPSPKLATSLLPPVEDDEDDDDYIPTRATVKTSASEKTSPSRSNVNSSSGSRRRGKVASFDELSDAKIKTLLRNSGFVVWSQRKAHSSEYKTAYQTAAAALKDHMDNKKDISDFDGSVFEWPVSAAPPIAPRRGQPGSLRRAGLRAPSEVKKTRKLAEYEDTLSELDEIQSSKTKKRAGKLVHDIKAKIDEPDVVYEKEEDTEADETD
ncbi:hypothetical protein BJ508DRAFT_337055, partial [Ascobolus immersus RN42]